MNKSYFYIVLSVFFISCISYKNPIAGKYLRSSKGLNNYNTLELDTNHTFKFGMYWCTGGRIEEGPWSRENNKLILNSFPFIRNNDSVSVLLESKEINNDDDSITLEFIDDSLEVLIGVNVNGFSESKILDGTVSDIDGIAKIRKYKYDSIFVNYIGFSGIVIHPVNNNYYKIKMRSGNSFDEIDYNSSFHFVNDKWKIRRNKLQDPRLKKRKRHNTYYRVKTNT